MLLLLQDAKATSIPNGACGYGALTAAANPGLNFAGVSFKKSIFSKYALKGCGVCLEIRCADEVGLLCLLSKQCYRHQVALKHDSARGTA